MDAWVDRELGGAFPDRRLRDRLVKILGDLGRRVGATIPAACQDWAATKATYRVFTNRRRDRIKLLYWDRDGHAIWMKRLERVTYRWPAPGVAVLEWIPAELAAMLGGIDLKATRQDTPAFRLDRSGSGEGRVVSLTELRAGGTGCTWGATEGAERRPC